LIFRACAFEIVFFTLNTIGISNKKFHFIGTLTIIYLPLKWCGQAFKLFIQILQEKSYFPAGETHDPSKCLFAQFHAAQTDKMKSEILEQLTGESERHNIRVVFATVAIGLGVNIPNVRQVIHIGPPRTIESYYQEIGRAGRDGRSAKAVLYYNGSDIATNKPDMTDEMRVFCSTVKTCLREYMLKYLGSTCQLKYLPHSCCSNCALSCMYMPNMQGDCNLTTTVVQ
jgi:hypothetical protein